MGWSDGSFGLFEGGSGRCVGEGRVGGRAGEEGEWRLDLEPGWGYEEEGEGVGMGMGGFGWEAHVVRREEGGGLKSFDGLDTEGWADGFEELERRAGVGHGLREKGVNGFLADLPRTVTMMDVSKIYPRLSAIPSHGLRSGPEGNRFGTQVATDAVFETKKEDVADTVDVLLAYTAAGEAQVLLDEAVPIGTFSTGSQVLQHAAHAQSGMHALLSQSEAGDYRLHLQDLPLSNLSGPLLHVIARDTKRTQTLLAYITQTIRCITHDYTTGLQFPIRLMNNINMTLSEAETPQGDLVYNLCRLCMTGHFTPPMLEWLTDIVKEPNHKRWDQVVGGMYQHIQNHVFVNLLPALDRMTMAVTSLRGLARVHQTTGKFMIDPALFTNILEAIDALRLVAKKVQRIVIDEWQQFRAFSKWLRVQIEIGAAGPYSKSAMETEEKESGNLDHALVLQYVKGPMVQSRLVGYVQKLAELKGTLTKEEFLKHSVVEGMGYERTKEALRRVNEAERTETEATPPVEASLVNLQAIAVALTGHVRVAMDSITAWQSKMLAPPTIVNELALQPSASICDMRLLVHEEPVVSILAIDSDILTFTQTTKSGGSELFTHQPDPPVQLLDAKYLSDSLVLCLYQSLEDSSYALSCVHFSLTPVSLEQQEEELLHVFPTEEGFGPEKLLVGGREGKEIAVVFGDGGKGWRVFDVSFSARQRSAGAAGRMVDDEWDDEGMDVDAGR